MANLLRDLGVFFAFIATQIIIMHQHSINVSDILNIPIIVVQKKLITKTVKRIIKKIQFTKITLKTKIQTWCAAMTSLNFKFCTATSNSYNKNINNKHNE